VGRGGLDGSPRPSAIDGKSRNDGGRGWPWEGKWHRGCRGGRRGKGRANGAAAGELTGRRDAMGPRVGREVRAANDYRQQIYATAGVRRMSTTAGRKII